jgi:hypothetical protein
MPQNTQRITVPCCEVCRLEGQDDEALYRNLLISTLESERNGIARKLSAKRDRSFNEDYTQLQKAVAHMKPVRVKTPLGVMLVPAFDFDTPEMNRFVLRMCRALLHAETKCGFRESRIVRWKVNPEEELRDIVQAGQGRVISEEFSYAGIFSVGEKSSAWLLNFYQSLEFFAIMETQWDQAPNPLRQRPG